MHMRAESYARREAVPASLLGMLIFVGTEVMFFAGFISAFTISRAGAPAGTWNLPDGQMLPAAATAANTAALLLSGVLVWLAGRQFARGSMHTGRTLAAATALGALFVVLQGREWSGLLSQGVTLWSSRLGAFFYVIVGMHALHALAAIIGLGVALDRWRRRRLSPGFLLGASTFWYFVVVIWPVIYARVYF
jgi:heme/copper-type cytochrome/quinol oxidase subunit 3